MARRAPGAPAEAASGSARLLERVATCALLALAAVLRLPGLAARGTWDSDQANDMATLQAFVADGRIPLLGPPTSIGNVHHGALYYDLLAPAAALTGGRDPVAVVGLIALLSIASVLVVWWLGRGLGGPIAGFVAGLVAAVSATGVETATFIWNPNPIPLFAALAVGGAVAAWRTRRPRWWLLAGVGAAVVAQLHVLGVLALPALALLFVADLRRARWAREAREAREAWEALLRAGAGALALVVAGYLPLLLHEVTSGFSETQHFLAWLGAQGAGEGGTPLVVRLVFVPLRVVAWPLTGLITDAPAAAALATGALAGIAAWRLRAGDAAERAAVRFLLAWVLIAAFLLVFAARSLGTVTPGLPNDHYHAFVAPALFALVGLGAAALWRRDPAARALAVAGVGALVGWNLLTQPPSVAADGGWPAAESAGARLAIDAKGAPLAFISLPSFKPPTAYTWPFRRAGGSIGEVVAAPRVAVLCDDLFSSAIGAACGGPAEAVVLADAGLGAAALEDRFSPAAGRTLSVYRIGEP